MTNNNTTPAPLSIRELNELVTLIEGIDWAVANWAALWGANSSTFAEIKAEQGEKRARLVALLPPGHRLRG